MRTINKFLLALIAISAVATTSCKEEEPSAPDAIEIDSIVLTPKTIEMAFGEKELVRAKIYPISATATLEDLNWTTSDAGLVMISDGVMKFIESNDKEGTATITASYKKYKGTCIVTIVNKEIPVQSISIKTSAIQVGRGSKTQLAAEVWPENATDKVIVWESNKPTIATVSDKGLVTAVSNGFASITASCGGKASRCSVEVM